MKKTLIVAVFTLFSLGASSQPYQLLKSNEQRIYGAYSQTVGLEVLQVDFDGDSVFWPAPHWINEAQFSECVYPDTSSGLGRSIRIAENGITTFHTLADEHFILHTLANPGDDPWTAYTAPDASWYLECFVSEHVLENVLGSPDSVKTFEFQAFDSDGIPIDQWITGQSIRIGKQMGLIKAPHIGIFPEWTSTYGAYAFHQLLGIEGGGGLQNLKWFEVYDFQVDDEIHIERKVSNYGEGFIEHSLITYLSRQDFPDSIVYETEVERWYYQGNMQNVVMSYQGTTVEFQTVRSNAGFDALPATPVIDDYDPGWGVSGSYYQLHTYENFPAKFFPRGEPMYYSVFEEFPGCYWEGIDWGCFSGDHAYYVKGLGGPYSQCSSGAPSFQHTALMYFNKSGEEWGSPLSTSEGKRVDAVALKAYPNPSGNSFRLELPVESYPLQLSVYDLSGRELAAYNLNHPESEIQTRGLPRGMVLLHVSTSEGHTFHGKLLVNMSE